jgi:aspartate oxidase
MASGHDRPMTAHTSDVLVIGSGAAGLTAALTLAQERSVTVLAKGQLTGGSTAWAQGGIAAVLDAGDTFEDHIRDTMVAGAGLNRRETVEFVIERAPRATNMDSVGAGRVYQLSTEPRGATGEIGRPSGSERV